MRLSVSPAVISCSGYKPEPPRTGWLTIIAAIVGICIVQAATIALGLPLANFVMDHAQ